MPKRTIKQSRDKAKTTRSAVTNRTRLFLGPLAVDGRSMLARRFTDHFDDLLVQLGDDPTPAQEAVCRNAASLMVLCEIDQARVAGGQPIDDDLFLRRIEVLRKSLTTIGLRRFARDVTPQPSGRVAVDAHAHAVRTVGGDSDD